MGGHLTGGVPAERKPERLWHRRLQATRKPLHFTAHRHLTLLQEQYTERWDYADWHSREPRIPGCYGYWTMLWSTACVMYQLVTLEWDPPDHRAPFMPQFEINGAAAQDWTFGWDLQAFPYSNRLIHLIYECLYETPDYRPELPDIRKRIARGIQSALEADAPIEPWEDFVMAEPVDVLPPPVAGPPVPPAAVPPAAASDPLVSTIFSMT